AARRLAAHPRTPAPPRRMDRSDAGDDLARGASRLNGLIAFPGIKEPRQRGRGSRRAGHTTHVLGVTEPAWGPAGSPAAATSAGRYWPRATHWPAGPSPSRWCTRP